MKYVGPEMIREHDRAFGFGTVVMHAKKAAENGMQADHFKIRTVNDAGNSNNARFAETENGERDGLEKSPIRKRI